jgi:hypothetical protein
LALNIGSFVGSLFDRLVVESKRGQAMSSRLRIVIVGCLALSPVSAMADTDPLSGIALSHACAIAVSSEATPTNILEASQVGICDGVISSVLYWGKTLQPPYSICAPDNSTRGQAMLVVGKYLENHPEQLNENLIGLVQRALVEEWPCPAQ